MKGESGITSREIVIEDTGKEPEGEGDQEKQKGKAKEEKDNNNKCEKKRKFEGKDKSKDISKLKQKLEKINSKIYALLEKKADILRQINEAENTTNEVAV